MRGFAAIIVTILFYSAAPMQAMADVSPLGCAWDKLSAAEQERLRDGFRVNIKDTTFTLFFGSPDATAAAGAAQSCQLTVTPAQSEALATALSRHAAVEKAKAGITDKGENPAAIQTALEKMHEGKREIIGNALSCPGPHNSVGEWEESVKGAIRRASLHFKNSRAFAWVSLGVYANMAEEGAMRRFAGTNTEPCPAN